MKVRVHSTPIVRGSPVVLHTSWTKWIFIDILQRTQKRLRNNSVSYKVIRNFVKDFNVRCRQFDKEGKDDALHSGLIEMNAKPLFAIRA